MMWVRLAILGLLAGCASTSPAEFDRRMTTYIGRPEADLIAGLGVPQRTYDSDGQRLLHYDLARIMRRVVLPRTKAREMAEPRILLQKTQ